MFKSVQYSFSSTTERLAKQMKHTSALLGEQPLQVIESSELTHFDSVHMTSPPSSMLVLLQMVNVHQEWKTVPWSLRPVS